MPAPVTIPTCDIASLAAQGSVFNPFDQVDALALKVYIQALILKGATTGQIDKTDICALAKTFSKYDGLSDTQRRSAELFVWNTGVSHSYPFDINAAKDAIACAHCCDVTPQSLKAAEICLTYWTGHIS